MSKAVKTCWTMVRMDEASALSSVFCVSLGGDTFFAILTTELIKSSHRISSKDNAPFALDGRFGAFVTDRDR